MSMNMQALGAICAVLLMAACGGGDAAGTGAGGEEVRGALSDGVMGPNADLSSSSDGTYVPEDPGTSPAEDFAGGKDALEPQETTSPPADIGSDATLEEFLEFHNIDPLTSEEDRETGRGVTDDSGRAAFYSYHHNALVEFVALAEDQTPLVGMAVALQLFDDATGMAFVFDPTGVRAPAMYEGEFGEGTIAVESDSGVDDIVEFEEGGPSPFPGQQFSLLSVSFSSMLSFTMKMAVTSTIAYVVKKWVKELCLFAAPLHEKACNIASMVAGLATGVAMGGVQLALKEGLTWSGLAGVVVDELLDFGCGDVFGAVLAAWGPVEGLMGNGALKDEIQLLFKQAVWKYNYMMEMSDSGDNPPDGAEWPAIESLVVKGLQASAALRPAVLENYFIALSPNKTYLEEQLSAGNFFKYASGLVKEAVTEHIFTVTSYVELQSLLIDVTVFFHQVPGGTVVETTMNIDYFHYQRVEGEWSTKNLDSKKFSCGLAAFTALTGYIQDAAGNTLQSLAAKSTLEIVRDQLTLLNLQADALYKLGWGEDITVPDCLPDILEPNNTWQNAPTVANLGTAVTVEDMLLMEGESDWYRFPLGGLINRVQAGVEWDDEQPGLSGCSTGTEEVCLEVLWYSDMYEMLDMAPSSFGGGMCQNIGPGGYFETEQYLLAPVMGETGPGVFIHLKSPEDATSVVPYKLKLYGTD